MATGTASPLARLIVACGALLALRHYGGCEAKVIRGTVSSRRAWEESGQFVAKFCFHGKAECVLFSTHLTRVAQR